MKFMVKLLLAAVLALSLAVGYQFGAVSSARSAGRAQTCAAFDKQIKTFVGLIKTSETQLPKTAYYKEHPGELATAIKSSEHSIVVIKSSLPNYC